MSYKKLRLMIATIIISTISLLGCSTDAVGNNIYTENGQEAIKNDEKKEDIEKKEIQYANIDEIVEEGYEKVDAYLENEWQGNGFQGVALVAVGDEIKFAKSYGYAEIDEKRENTLTTRFAIASNTKQFTAVAVLQLVEDGKINLDDTIDKYFPEYQYGSSITVRDLLQMRSGFIDYLNDAGTYMQSDESKEILNTYKDEKYFDKYVEDERWSKDIILDNLYLNGLSSEPGVIFDYCNTNYYLLGLIIEEVTGITYEEYVQENIFEPCNMVTASMEEKEDDAKGHGNEVSGEISAQPEFTYAAGNIYANVFDIFRWNRALHKGDIISDGMYNEMITPVDEYGYGVFVKDGIIKHSGVIDGFNSNTQYNINTDTTIIVLENKDNTTGLLDAKYETYMIDSLIK